jgi:hypothetical protein
MNRFGLPLLAWIVIAVPCHSKPVRPSNDSPEKDRSPIVIDHDVVEFEFREALIPFEVSRESQAGMRAIRLHVSEDSGRTWKVADGRKPNENRFVFRTTRDGLCYFAIQSVMIDGSCNPPDSKGLVTNLKVYVNKDKRPLSRKPAPQANQ